ncbi:4'-phosphopantetheinyl transferase [Enterococcus lactis]|uniref:4'-phosphopantetheinyl transferase n=1 Tax=Enterococcus lactis TaxID=357441 RepID=UPI0022E1F193|nr:4'-phosphopantetheinyl transferase [Enterococcus lactis]
MLETAIEVLEKCAQLVTTPEEWGYESVTMEKEEIEMGILPRLVMTHLYIYCAPEDGKDYVVYFITDITSQREFVRGLLVEGRLVWSQIGGTNE